MRVIAIGFARLGLAAAAHVLHYDRWWNPAVEDQATDRAYRIGQMRPVQVHKLLTAGSVEAAKWKTRREIVDISPVNGG